MPCKFKYELQAEVLMDGNAKFSKYISLNSGITICIAEVNGPIVGGYFTFATETFDDDGLPHTLEHLVFLGSEKYPYKGVLDVVSNRCLSQGTNAWTDIDHTCYTVTTAGYDGFLKILPIYLDHLLFPTLTDAAFTTEIHHINGEGEDAGVVYCEMQGRENSGENRCYNAMFHALYPGHCGYKSETGGFVKNLRESTTNQKVKAYHKEFYRPENLCLIIVGQIDAEKIFESLVPVEERILQEGEKPKFVRPWQSPVPPLTESVVRTIQYPTYEDEYGLVLTAWRGPSANDFANFISIQILLDYLTDTSIAPLSRDFVEIEDALCNEVDFFVIENSVTCFCLYFASVPVAKLNEIKDKLLVTLKNIADGNEKIDMQRMKTLINKRKLHILSSMENKPHSTVAGSLIGYFLYGSTQEHLEGRLKEIPLVEKLIEKDDQYWINLLRTYMIEGNNVVILGSPSKKLSKEMQEAEKQRIKEQQKSLGPDGLKEKERILKNAIATNEIPHPEELLTSVSVPSLKSIQFHPIKRNCNVRESEGDDVHYSVKKMPCRFEVDDIQTNFVRLYILIDTSHLTLESRMYLPLLIELLDECAITRDGKIVPYQDVIKQLAEDTISISASLGLSYSRFCCGSYAQVMCLNLMVEEHKYEKSVHWLREILYQICIEPSRIKSIANKIITDVPSMKQNGNAVASAIMKNLNFQHDHNCWTSSFIKQSGFLSELIKQLEIQPEKIVQKLNEIRHCLIKPENMVVHLALNVDNLKKKMEPEKVWIQNFLPLTVSSNVMRTPLKKCSDYVLPFNGDGIRGFIVGLGSIECSFMQQTISCPVTKTHPDYASLLVACNYFVMSEGPMWKSIRGSGLAYGYGMHLDSDVGLLYFSLYRSTNVFKAYKESVNIIESHLNGTTKWNMAQLESTRLALISELVEQLKTISKVVKMSLKCFCQGTDIDFNKEFQELFGKINKVTTSDMERVGVQYLKPLFDSQLSKCCITCNSSKVNEILENFKTVSRELTEVPSLDDSSISKYW